MSWPKRLPEEDYAAAIAEAEAYLRNYLPEEVPAGPSFTWTMATFRIRQAEAELRDLLEPWMSTREFLCSALIARTEAGEEEAAIDLKVLAIDYLDAAIEGRNDVVAPGALLGYVRDVLVDSLPHDEGYLGVGLHFHIAWAVDMMLAKLPGIRPTRNQVSRTEKHPESACSLVAKALANVKCARSESTVQKAWESHGAFYELTRSKS